MDEMRDHLSFPACKVIAAISGRSDIPKYRLSEVFSRAFGEEIITRLYPGDSVLKDDPERFSYRLFAIYFNEGIDKLEKYIVDSVLIVFPEFSSMVPSVEKIAIDNNA